MKSAAADTMIPASYCPAFVSFSFLFDLISTFVTQLELRLDVSCKRQNTGQVHNSWVKGLEEISHSNTQEYRRLIKPRGSKITHFTSLHFIPKLTVFTQVALWGCKSAFRQWVSAVIITVSTNVIVVRRVAIRRKRAGATLCIYTANRYYTCTKQQHQHPLTAGGSHCHRLWTTSQIIFYANASSYLSGSLDE